MEKIIIIGAGASGLTAAINAKTSNNEVLIIEKNNQAGKKILITGNGKCNYLNETFEINNYKSNNKEILEKIINKDNKQRIITFFDKLGIMPKIRNGYYYPASNQAITIRESLVKECNINNIEIKYEEEVTDINYINNKYKITTKNNNYECDKLIISTGGMAAPNTGSDGFGYKILKEFNHTIIKPLPALTPLKCENNLKELKGVRTDAILNLYENNKYIESSRGELQINEKEISGICTFQISGRAIRSINNNNKISVHINFLPSLEINNNEELINYIEKRNEKLEKRTISELLDGLLNYKIVNFLLKTNKINKDSKWNELKTIEKSNLVNSLINYEIKIINENSFDKAQVTSGGIPLNEININTMESLKQKNLYIIGELLDVDGDCGGYNLGFAWLSGIIAGNEVKKDN